MISDRQQQRGIKEMTYNINSQYKRKVTYPKGMTDNPVTYNYVTEGINLIIHNINGEVV